VIDWRAAAALRACTRDVRVRFLRTPPGWIDGVIGAVLAATVTVTPLAAAAGSLWIADGTIDGVVAWKNDEVKARHQLARSILGDVATGSLESQPGYSCRRAGRPRILRVTHVNAASSSHRSGISLLPVTTRPMRCVFASVHRPNGNHSSARSRF
jgi:hypothetical protein